MTPRETILVWSAIFLYGLLSTLHIYAVVFARPRLLGRLRLVLLGVLALHGAAIVERTFAVGNLPLATDYENALSISWLVTLFTAYLAWRRPALSAAGAGTVPVALLLLGYGVMRNPVLAPMSASLKSTWLYVHLAFAWLSFGAYALAFGVAVVYLLTGRGRARALAERLPSRERLDDYQFRYVVFGFVAEAVMIGSGAIWARDLWGSYWSWDPVEVWSLISWVIYGLAIHLRVTLGWRGRRLAWVIVGALASVFITFFGIHLVVDTSLHFFRAWQEM